MPQAPTQVNPPLTRAERSVYEETSRYAEVLEFIDSLQSSSPLIRVETFGRSHEGRELPLMVLADPPLSTPRQAAESGKPIVFVMANIHAGEVEGKEASLHFARRLLTGDLKALLEKTIFLIAPIYNADGNERISAQNRTAQFGPIAGVGTRENAQGLDLNRDYMKAEAPETRALLGIFNRWDPHITVDLHTTNGSHHGYHLTYSIPLNPTNDPNILSYHRRKLMPAIQKAVKERHGFRTYYYGNFTGEGKQRTWRAFIPQPRAGQNYIGFRNRLTILTEAYSYIDFKSRIAVTEAMLEETGRFAAAHGAEILRLTRRADERITKRGPSESSPVIGVDYELQSLPKLVDILVGEVTRVRNPRNGRDMTVMVEDKFKPVAMQAFGVYSITRSVKSAHAYLVPNHEAYAQVVEKLHAHGITVEELTSPLSGELTHFVIDEIIRADRPFQGHRTIRLKGTYDSREASVPVGTFVVRTTQPLGLLAAYLLEPESDDGLAAWNFLDALLEKAKPYPILKLMKARNLCTKIVMPDTSKPPSRPLNTNPTAREPMSHEE